MRSLVEKIHQCKEVMTSSPVLLLALAVAAWGMNGLMLQDVEFEHQSTLAVSHHRIDALRSLAASRGHSTPYQILHCSLSTEETPDLTHSDMRTVKLRVRARHHVDLQHLEAFLQNATRPVEESEETKSIAKEIRFTRWNLQSMQHLQNGCVQECEKLASLGYDILSKASPVPTLFANHDSPSSPFRLIGFKKGASAPNTSEMVNREQIDSIAALQAGIASECRECESKLENLEESLAASRESSAGYLSFTGAQQQFPVVRPVGWSKLIAALIVGGSLWGLVAIAVHQFPRTSFDSLAMAFRNLRKGLAKNSEGRASNKPKELAIPCLGTFSRSGGESNAVKHCQNPSTASGFIVARASCPRVRYRFGRDIRTMTLPLPGRNTSQRCMPGDCLPGGWIQNLGTLVLSAWGLTIAVRFLADATWRELFLTAPLAGLTHLISGAP